MKGGTIKINSKAKEDFKLFEKLIEINDLDIGKYFVVLPKIPQLMFGESIVNKYYTKQFQLEQLKNNYEMVMNILESNKDLLEKITIPNTFLSFMNTNFIFYNNITGNLDNDFKKIFKDNNLDDIIIKYINNNGIINFASNKSKPFFYQLFSNYFQSNDPSIKEFFDNCFREYNSLRKNTINELNKYYGISSLSMFFDIEHINDDNNNITSVKNSTYLNKYRIKEQNYTNSKNNPNPENISLPKKPHQKSNLELVKNETKYTSMFQKKLNPSDISVQYDKLSKDYFSNFYDNIKMIVMEMRKKSLYELLYNAIRLDFYSLQFFYYYLGKNKFTLIIQTKNEIDSYINGYIQQYQQYRLEFIDWLKHHVEGISTNDFNERNDPYEKQMFIDKVTDKYIDKFIEDKKSIVDEYKLFVKYSDIIQQEKTQYNKKIQNYITQIQGMRQ